MKSTIQMMKGIVWMKFNNMEGIIDQMMKFNNVDEIKIYG